MADDKKEQNAVKAGTPFSVRFAFFMVLVTAVVFLPTTIVFFIGLIPTMVAALIDNNPRKTAWLTVGMMNVAGTVPVWFSLLDAGHTIPAAFQLITQPSTIILSYGGAGIGSLIYYKVTPLVAAFVQGKNERRLRDIDKRQKFLVKKWGEDVITK